MSNRLHGNERRLTAKIKCACGRHFTTKGIKQHQRACAVQQAAWAPRAPRVIYNGGP